MILARILSYLPHFYTRRSCVVDASTDVPSSPSQPTCGLRPRPLSPTYRLSLSNIGVVVLEQTSYLIVVRTKCRLAMIEDIATVERIGTWDIVSLPPRVLPITWWVYKVKTRSNGSLEHYKARLVARSFQR